MRAVISITVAATIALHTVLGCCWHHAHAAAPVATEVQTKVETPTKATKRCCCHGRQTRPLPAEQGLQRHHSDKSCPGPCGKKCDSAALSRTAEHDSTVHSVVVISAMPDQPLLIPAVPTLRDCSLDNLVEAPPIRRHLLHQLLLI